LQFAEIKTLVAKIYGKQKQYVNEDDHI